MFFTIKEIAAKLQISESKVYSLVQRGELPSYQIGSCRRISEEDLNEFLRLRRVDSPKLRTSQHTHF